jgi:hypothetical protein
VPYGRHIRASQRQRPPAEIREVAGGFNATRDQPFGLRPLARAGSSSGPHRRFVGFGLLLPNPLSDPVGGVACACAVPAHRRLRSIFRRGGDRLLSCDHVGGNGEELFQLACENDLEGIVAKPKSAPYREPTWFKGVVRARQSDPDGHGWDACVARCVATGPSGL